ncbi:TetR/AcrR family transcriptional regulator [Amycolatopsis pithecellobii]|uniref:TetR family transcriptional regulator n=1 Tax=Amycolatopsis pithecellobii TaxID=664692 RepID=A0A6N7YUC3_9PSEU|nr:TetR/AcrR family transcriptional regulator [Amycolatopsis pithecellobii]MTD55528.1 TetR family transcriptional regulator [Amycolatopsis pithecellobii]
MDGLPAPTRRDRLRAQTLEEITEHAIAVLDAEGADALTLASIAKSTGISTPGLYRYFASRDALLDELQVVAHVQLAGALERRAADSAELAPPQRVRAVVDAYRGWALAHPKRYALMFGDRVAGEGNASRVAAAASRGMEVLIAALGELWATNLETLPNERLDRQLHDWIRSRTGTRAPSHILRAAVFTWTRLHGIVSLELSGSFASMGFDPQLLLEAEIQNALAGLTSASK